MHPDQEHHIDYPCPRVPLEVCQEIIDVVGAHARSDPDSAEHEPFCIQYIVVDWRPTLVACASVCKAWHVRSLRHLLVQVWLSSRRQIVSLSNLLRQHRDIQTGIRHVAVHGLEPDRPNNLTTRNLHYFDTFVLMLARQLPNITSLSLLDGHWKVACMVAKNTKYLALHTTLTHLRLRNVTFTTASHFASLLSALPNLVYINCEDVTCRQKQLISQLPQSAHTNLREVLLDEPVDDAIVNTLGKFGAVAAVVDTLSSPDDANSYPRLLDAYSPSLRYLNIDWDSERELIDLSPQARLTALSLQFTRSIVDIPDFAKVAATLSTITSNVISRIYIRFSCGNLAHMDEDEWAMTFLDKLEHDDSLRRIDELLSGPNFENIEQSGVWFEISMEASCHARLMALTKSKEYWTQLLDKRMPQAAERKILEGAFDTWEMNAVEYGEEPRPPSRGKLELDK
ncbi:hypothetical protein DAEQUDRAFT_713332 [Daedalea quercina L-15889]|uniref:F-box domain-containing protein n=1 Tax=Daedalea quercina L-15889 TaxID=1314783 RepID=A0A165NYW7_9APHY|nr:hypothetical protein DAEQUDRAFT_713332 [Daedalea quercina L-15889]